MAANRASPLSTSELSVEKADAATDLPSDPEGRSEDCLSDGEDTALEQIGPSSGAPSAARSPVSPPRRGRSAGSSGGDCSRSSRSSAGVAAAITSAADEAAVPQPPTPLSQSALLDEWFATALAPAASAEKVGDSPTALFLDYDGTLREFEARPELAVPTPALQDLLRALNSCENLLVHIISGRDASFLSSHFGCYRRIVLIAEHERRLAGRFQVWRPESDVCFSTRRENAQPQTWRPAVLQEFSQTAAQVAGSQIEEKPSALVWHYRGVADEAAGTAAADALVESLARLRDAPAMPALQISHGNKTVEVSRRNLAKGDVMRRICATRAKTGKPFKAVLVAGDDVSDESMFEAAQDDFLTIKVGRGTTRARYCVESPEELRTLLWKLTAKAPSSGS